jgi:hypothetical protein
MADPEIARRCRFCGASIRIRGSFCPQCGNPTSETVDEVPDVERAVKTEEVFDASETVSVDLSGLPTTDLTNGNPAMAETVPLYPIPDIDRPVMRQDDRPTVPLSATPHPAIAPREDGARPRPVRKAFGGDVKKGLGKVREISTVVLEEASYDPSARFVLVAAVLFILFLVILLLSEMTR